VSRGTRLSPSRECRSGFGEPLELADTKSEMESLLEWQRRKDRARKAAELQRQLEAERRAAEEAERQRQARLEAERKAAEEAERQRLARLEAERQAEARRIASYIGAYPQEPAHYAVFAVDARGERVLELMSEITKSLHSIEGMKVTDQAFAAPFASEEGFERVVSGRGEDELGAMEVRKAADSLLLIRAGREEVGRSTQVSDVQTFSMPVTVTIISTSDGAIQHEYAVNDVTGAGVSEPAAKTPYISLCSSHRTGRFHRNFSRLSPSGSSPRRIASIMSGARLISGRRRCQSQMSPVPNVSGTGSRRGIAPAKRPS